MTTRERRDARRRRYLNLGVGELVAAVVFALVLDLRGARAPGPPDS